MAKHAVARTEEIPAGKRKLVTVGGRPIVIFNVSGDYYALLDRCPHQGASLCKGVQTGLGVSEGPGNYSYGRTGEIVKCPWHGWEFDVKTGWSVFDPSGTRVRAFPAEQMDGADIPEGMLKAETFPVSIEESYVVVEV